MSSLRYFLSPIFSIGWFTWQQWSKDLNFRIVASICVWTMEVCLHEPFEERCLHAHLGGLSNNAIQHPPWPNWVKSCLYTYLQESTLQLWKVISDEGFQDRREAVRECPNSSYNTLYTPATNNYDLEQVILPEARFGKKKGKKRNHMCIHRYYTVANFYNVYEQLAALVTHHHTATWIAWQKLNMYHMHRTIM